MANKVLGVLVLGILISSLTTISMAEDISSTFETKGEMEESSETCCKSCPCTRSIPPQCQCTDIRNFCPSTCKNCLCTRSWPPQCRCTDITDHCPKPCSTSSST